MEEVQAFQKSQIRPSSSAFQRPSDSTGSMDLVGILHKAYEGMKMRGD